MNDQCYFYERENAYVPASAACSPWNSGDLHGCAIAGLLAFEIERRHGDPDRVPARLTIDFLHRATASPVTVVTTLVRDGHRIKIVDAELFCGGLRAARASCQLVRKSANATGEIWSPHTWEVPAPETLPIPPLFKDGRRPAWTSIGDEIPAPTQRRIWINESRDVVNGVPLTPWTRVALAADFANPCANMSADSLGYINSDTTLRLHRLPRGRWIGMETINHQATVGVALGECFVYDQDGPLGSSSVCALAQRAPLAKRK